MAERIVPLVAEVGTDLCRVELKGGSLGGYRCEILNENLSERENAIYKCPRCKGIMKDCSTTEKGEQLCACCLIVGEQPHSNAPIRITILSLKCSCPLSKRGCDWLGKLGNVEYHMTVCQYVYVSCELMCGVVLTRDEMIGHVREECTQREEACLHCSGMYKVCEMAAHVEVCGKVEVMCELGCGTRMHREDTLYHRQNECSEETVMCPYVKYGCEVMGLKRRELKQHLEENRLLHTELKLDTLAEDNILLKKHIQGLEHELEVKDVEIKSLVEANQFRQKGIVKWSIKHILKYFKPHLGFFSSLGSTLSKDFSIAMCPFTLSHHTTGAGFKIYLTLVKSSNHESLDWPLSMTIITRVISQKDVKDSLLTTIPLIEMQRGNFGLLSSKPIEICSIPLSTDLEDFIRSDCLDLEITICIMKNTTFHSL